MLNRKLLQKKLSGFEKFAACVDICAKIVAILGAVWVGIEYFSNQKSQKIQNTLEFVSRFDESEFSHSRQMIFHAIESRIEAIKELNQDFAKGEITKEQYDELVRYETKLIVENGKSGNISNDLLRVSDFYTGLNICVENKVCDKSTADKFFRPFASSFWDWFRDYFVSGRAENGKDFGSGIEGFLKNSEGEASGK